MIAEGRDQGTVVFPDAYRKFFLTASLDERARRRHAEYAARGEAIAVEDVVRDLRDRDARDEARAIAPMKPAADARIIDTTGLALDEVVARIERDIRGDGAAVSRPSDPTRPAEAGPAADRSPLALLWYRLVRLVAVLVFAATGGIRATGRGHMPAAGGALLVSNHLSHLDVFALGITAARPLNYVARSTLFFPPLGALIRSVGGFAIQREGMGRRA